MTTLARQLLAGISVIFLAGLAGVAAIYVHNSRLYLQQQLESHAQDAATSLGLSVGAGPPADVTFIQTSINALFDRGHYERIVFTHANGHIVVDKALPARDYGVPVWFSELLPLTAPTASSLVSQGWRQLGRVSVTSHPRLAYRQLWTTGYETLLWLAVVYAFALVAMRYFLAGLLRPLRQIEETAVAVAARDYRRIPVVPRARELRAVVEAINTLSSRVRETIESETARAEALRREAFSDPLTGQANRRGFEQQYASHVTNDRDVFSGTLSIVELHGLAAFNREHGYARGDEALKLAAAAMGEWSAGRDAISARWAGATFVAMVVNQGSDVAAAGAAELCRRLADRFAAQRLLVRFNVGAAAFDHGKPPLGTLLAAADAALRRAEQRGSGLANVELIEPGTGSAQWQERLTSALQRDRFVLYGQPAASLPDRATLHLEVTTRILDEGGEAIPAATYLPVAARLGLVQALDRKMLERVFAHLASGADATPLAVNVSASSAADAAFVHWLQARLQADRALAARLSFEISESGVMRDTAAALAFAQSVRAAGSRFAVDAFGIHRESLQLLKQVLPDYVKLSASHTETLADDASTRFFVESVVRVARSLDIRVLAQAVEKEELMPLLEELGLAGFQGFLLGLPKPLG